MNAAEALKGIVYHIAVLVLGALARLLFRLRVRGRENLPVHGGFLLVARHCSYWDIPLLCVALGRHRRVYFVARHTLLTENPFFAFFVRRYAITIDRENFRVEDFRKVIQALQDQKIVGIFPEGTTRNPQRVHPGVIRFAERTASEFVPIGLEARGPYPPQYPLIWPQLTAHIGVPFSLRDLEFDLDNTEDRHERYQKLADLLMERVDRTGMQTPSNNAERARV